MQSLIFNFYLCQFLWSFQKQLKSKLMFPRVFFSFPHWFFFSLLIFCLSPHSVYFKSVSLSHPRIFLTILYWVSVSRGARGAGVLRGSLCEERPGTALCWTQLVPTGSSQFHQTHSRIQLSWVEWVAPQWKHISERAKSAGQRGRWTRKCKQQ